LFFLEIQRRIFMFKLDDVCDFHAVTK